ncbi:hypothetical protein Mal15_45010 [Stieleria maiorica]|uniref:Phytanoyl-CoA dioxygenase (PhyH) n=1 Tax=Stieleria maiorica TaxID=2795974 RepID=A0A5B9MKA7_9BACT|nr:hypothetical protein [Stieleria maiorica]QEG00431.1 hypothetical protein Mal15_45010 [Stieleria maiorica]
MVDLIQRYDGQTDAEFRSVLYSGTVLVMPASESTRRIREFCWDRICQVFGDDPRGATRRIDGETLFQKAGLLRREFYQSEVCRRGIADLLRQTGCDVDDHRCDPVRLRVITEGGHHNPAAAPVYYAHRDTWYSNPQCQITWWMPLHRVETTETFSFLPDYFDRAVGNDSGGFDYRQWTSKGTDLKIGWQDADAGRRELYPQLRESLPQHRRIAFEAEPGEVIVFSGQHLHQTVPIEQGETRLSVDFRTVCLSDHRQGAGPANVDNHSTGDALAGHVPVVSADLQQ